MRKTKPSVEALYQMLTYTADAYEGAPDQWTKDEMIRLGMAIKGCGYALWGRRWGQYLAELPIKCSWPVFQPDELTVPQPTTT